MWREVHAGARLSHAWSDDVLPIPRRGFLDPDTTRHVGVAGDDLDRAAAAGLLLDASSRHDDDVCFLLCAVLQGRSPSQ